VPKDIYLQPNVPDYLWDEQLVLQLTRRHVPQTRAVTHVDETGGEARSYAVDENLIVKTQRPNRLRPRTSLAKEVFFLNQIAAWRPDLSVPRVLGYGHEGPLVEYTVMTRMPGVALLRAKLEGEARLSVMRELGRTLRAIHALPQDAFKASELLPGDRHLGDVRQRAEEWLEDFVARIHNESRAWSPSLSPEEVSTRALALLPGDAESVALHSNPWHEHTFVDPATGKYSGLIDFGDAYISHPAFDMRRWRTRAEREALMEGYTSDAPVSDAFRQAWIASQIIGDMAVIAQSPSLASEANEDLQWLIRQF
jgi:aminoglycoside phosphotransferase